jgi:FdhD protein
MSVATTKSISITRLGEGKRSQTVDEVVAEYALTIFLNDVEVVTLLCTPAELRFLAAGYLYSEGLVRDREDIVEVSLNEAAGTARVATRSGLQPSPRRMVASGGGRGTVSAPAPPRIASDAKITVSGIFDLVARFAEHSDIFKATGGVHSAALCQDGSILVFSEDIGRHNAIDKVFGRCLLEGIMTEGRVLVTSGRVSSEILLKVARWRIPILISKSAATDAAVRLAETAGITLVGFVRGKKANVYAHGGRVDYNG